MSTRRRGPRKLWFWGWPVIASLALAGAVAAAAGGGDAPAKSVEVRYTRTPPKIDGTIEAIWQTADSATDFVQYQPFEKAAPSERTTVYLLRDDDNLYVAFRCYSLKRPPTANFTKDEDYVSIGIDTFGSKSTAYFFQVFGSGLFWDGLILDDGRVQDQTWDGVWYRADRMYPDRMEVEMKIPFKTIRYKAGLTEWGVQFRRHIASIFEDDYWTQVPQKDGDLVSRWGTLRNMDPESRGYYFEFYPEGYFRHDDYRGVGSANRPNGSFNLKWDLTPQTSLNATAYPDFAQIESDPYSLNLSRYPTYLQEQRPFFVEGTEIFRFSSLPNTGLFQPLNIFYSRRIGKSVDGDAVPIIAGGKLTHKTEEWGLGALAATTQSYRNVGEGIDEPRRDFGVLRARRRILGNSDVGLLASGMTAGPRDYNYAVGSEAVLRRGANELITQGGMSDRNGKKGWAVSSGYRGFVGKLLTMGTYEAVGDSFDVSDVGFEPWSGRQRVMLISGPYWTYRTGALSNLYIAPGFFRIREPGSPRWSTQAYANVNPNFRSSWGMSAEASYGPYYELDDVTNAFVRYISRSVDANFWGLLMGNNINGGVSYGNGFNYQRHYVAYQGQSWFTFSYSFIPPLSTTQVANLWVEWNPQNQVVGITPRYQPRLDLRMTAYQTISIFNEMVGYAPGPRLGRTRLQSDRTGLLYSWNFAPKSWIYVALNDYGALDYSLHPGGVMRQQYGIGAVKLRYLLYF